MLWYAIFSCLSFVCMATYATYAPGFVCNIFWVGDNWSYYTTTVALIYLRDWYSSWTACFTPCDMKTFDQLSYVHICVGNNVISVSPLQSTFKTMNLTDLDFDFRLPFISYAYKFHSFSFCSYTILHVFVLESDFGYFANWVILVQLISGGYIIYICKYYIIVLYNHWILSCMHSN